MEREHEVRVHLLNRCAVHLLQQAQARSARPIHMFLHPRKGAILLLLLVKPMHRACRMLQVHEGKLSSSAQHVRMSSYYLFSAQVSYL